MTTCVTEFHGTVEDNYGRPVRKDWVCGKQATHMEEDLQDSAIEYPVCKKCASVAYILGFNVREMTPEELL